MIENPAIIVKNVTKTYPLYNRPTDRVKETLHPLRKKYYRPFNALSDVSFELAKGETLGIIGANGSGKSTLLEILCGISNPTSGLVKVNGRISALLELGAGFNPEFTGRQNVYINGSILGLKPKEIDERFESIAAFADIGDFIDQPVKIYSSGMYIRLAFATVINVDPDILVVDEVLAVGDIYYQHKCMHRMKELIQKGTTLLFVSHDIGAVKALCKTTILLESGMIVKQGETEGVVNEYYYRMIQKEKNELTGISISREEREIEKNSAPVNVRKDVSFKRDENFLNRIKNTRSGTGEARIRYVEMIDEAEQSIHQCMLNDWIIIRGHIEFLTDCDTPNIGFIVRDKNGNDIIGTNLFVERIYLPGKIAGDHLVVDFKFKNILQDGTYSVTFAVSKSDDLGRFNIKTYDWVDNAMVFSTVSGSTKHIHTKVSIPIEINCYPK